MKYSKQRELILTYVQNTKTHPTAEMVYNNVRQKIPNISLGTVYRNLNQLCEYNLIRKISTPNKIDRFDNVYDNHGHLYCHECGKVEDISEEIISSVCDFIADKTNYDIISHDVILVGICRNCKKKRR
ncbi:MAG: transcriptional repressor [Mollicutes bacterium]|nr:transcriptional repressor [Mollicutes bacterium]